MLSHLVILSHYAVFFCIFFGVSEANLRLQSKRFLSQGFLFFEKKGLP